MATPIPRQASKVHLVDAFPEMVERLDAEQRRLAHRHLVATLYELDRGVWRPPREIRREPGYLGLLVLEGLLLRDVLLEQTLATELVGRGDVLRPMDHDGQDAPVPFDIAWHVVEPTRIAVLDRQFTHAAGHWPEAMEAVVRGAVGRAQSLAITLAVSHLRYVDSRLHLIMWYLADRWGRVRPDGVNVPLKLTHKMLGRLVGAQRPSVTTALKQLADDRRLTRAGDGTWLLHGDRPATLDRLREQSASARVRARDAGLPRG